MRYSPKSAGLFLLLLILQGFSPLLHAHPQGSCGSSGVHEHLQDNGAQDLHGHAPVPAQIDQARSLASADALITISMRSGVKQQEDTPGQNPQLVLPDPCMALAKIASLVVQGSQYAFQTLPPPRPKSRAPPFHLV